MRKNSDSEGLFNSFFNACSNLPRDVFINAKNNRFNIALFEAVFTASCSVAFKELRPVKGKVSLQKVKSLEVDKSFVAAATLGTTRTINVTQRLERAKKLVNPL